MDHAVLPVTWNTLPVTVHDLTQSDARTQTFLNPLTDSTNIAELHCLFAVVLVSHPTEGTRLSWFRWLGYISR